MTKPPSNTIAPNRFAAIDGLRGIAILWVTALHIWGLGPSPTHAPVMIGKLNLAPWLLSGGRGVALFFALSGFCLFYPIARQSEYKVDWKNFFMRRVIRIYPAYFLSLLIWFPIWGAANNYAGWKFQLITHITFTYGFFAASISAINGVLWSLATEDHFYLSMPVLARLMYRRPVLTLILSAVICIALNLYVYLWLPSSLNAYWGYYIRLLPLHLLEFTVGMFAAWHFARCKSPTRLQQAGLWVLGLSGLTITPYIHNWIYPIYASPHYHYWDEILYAPCYGALILAALWSPKAFLTRIISSGPLVGMGVISYSIYLYNFMMLEIPKALFPGLKGSNPLWLIAAGISVLACGILSYYLSEAPFIKLRSKLRRSKSTVIQVPEPVSNQQTALT